MGNKVFNVAYANKTKNIQPAIDSGDPNLGPGTLIMDEQDGSLGFVGDERKFYTSKIKKGQSEKSLFTETNEAGGTLKGPYGLKDGIVQEASLINGLKLSDLGEGDYVRLYYQQGEEYVIDKIKEYNNKSGEIIFEKEDATKVLYLEYDVSISSVAIGGESNKSTGYCSGAFGGRGNTASGTYSSVTGRANEVSGYVSTAEGIENKIYGGYSHGEGRKNIISEEASYCHIEGYQNKVEGNIKYSHLEGINNKISGIGSQAHVEGQNNTVTGTNSHGEGYSTMAPGDFAHSEGFGTKALGFASHSQNANTKAVADYSDAAGRNIITTTECGSARGRGNLIFEEYIPDNYTETIESNRLVPKGSGFKPLIDVVGGQLNDVSQFRNLYGLDINGNAYFGGNVYVFTTGTISGGGWNREATTENFTQLYTETDVKNLFKELFAANPSLTKPANWTWLD